MCLLSGQNVWVSLLMALLAGLLSGFVTGVLHTFMGSPAILAGIRTQLSLYSINLKIRGKEMCIRDSIYKVLICFEKLYNVMNPLERKKLMEHLISEIQIYPERQPNGQWLKSCLLYTSRCV